MPLIKDNDIVTLRKYVKINFTATAVKSMPDLDAADQEYLIPILTQPLFDSLQTQVNANNITQAVLLNLARAAEAPLSVFLDLPFIQTALGDNGLRSDPEAAHQWEFNKVELALASKGMKALERLLIYLIANASTLSWNNAEAKESFIRTGKEFSKWVSLVYPHLTFQQLKPIMTEVEDVIKGCIGEAYFAELRDKASPSQLEKDAILLIKKTVAQYTAMRAVERLIVKVTPNGLIASLQNDSEAFNAESPAGNNALDVYAAAAKRAGENYHGQLMDLLQSKASSTVFANFFTSEYYKAPVADAVNVNEQLNGFVSFS